MGAELNSRRPAAPRPGIIASLRLLVQLSGDQAIIDPYGLRTVLCAQRRWDAEYRHRAGRPMDSAGLHDGLAPIYRPCRGERRTLREIQLCLGGFPSQSDCSSTYLWNVVYFGDPIR